jgi:hypothetical protein
MIKLDAEVEGRLMSDYLSQSIREELATAQKAARRSNATRMVRVGAASFPIIEMTERGFSVDAEDAPRLRGLVDIYDGPRHLYRALIVASDQAGDLMRYEFKRNTAVATQAPVDFETVTDRPAGLLPSV